MATQAQMDADPYYRAEIVTEALDWLGDELCRATGRPRTAAGTKGDRFHVNGGHRSQRFILRSRLCTNRTYTLDLGISGAQLDWIAAFDFTPGSVEQMIVQCKRLIAAMKAGWLDELEAVYGNVDGDKVVDGWDNVRDRAATSDSSHLWHWHVTIQRRWAGSMALMRKIFAIVMGAYRHDVAASEEDDMHWFARADREGKPGDHLWFGNLDGRRLVHQDYRGVLEQTARVEGLGTIKLDSRGNAFIRGNCDGMGPEREEAGTVVIDYDKLAEAIVEKLPVGVIPPTADEIAAATGRLEAAADRARADVLDGPSA